MKLQKFCVKLEPSWTLWFSHAAHRSYRGFTFSIFDWLPRRPSCLFCTRDFPIMHFCQWGGLCFPEGGCRGHVDWRIGRTHTASKDTVWVAWAAVSSLRCCLTQQLPLDPTVSSWDWVYSHRETCGLLAGCLAAVRPLEPHCPVEEDSSWVWQLADDKLSLLSLWFPGAGQVTRHFQWLSWGFLSFWGPSEQVWGGKGAWMK